MDTEHEGTGGAVDLAGTIRVMAYRVLSRGAVFGSPHLGSVTPTQTLTHFTWWESMGTMVVQQQESALPNFLRLCAGITGNSNAT
ncbi:MAG: hypothetical protein M3O31_18280, partial [Acidobacteriota bacterium]|nr:hypothetical protein [Acidobacteriota bacterium]